MSNHECLHGLADPRAPVFKAPAEVGDEDEQSHSASAPLLSLGRATSSEEERELWESEGPNSGVRGTLMDGIANVRPTLVLSVLATN